VSRPDGWARAAQQELAAYKMEMKELRAHWRPRPSGYHSWTGACKTNYWEAQGPRAWPAGCNWAWTELALSPAVPAGCNWARKEWWD
jgi:hypothetical protein